MKKVNFKPLLPETAESYAAAEALFNNMRDADRTEMLLMGYNSIEYVTDSINTSKECFACYTEDGRILGIGGIADTSDFGLGVPIWFLASKDIAHYHKQLVRHGMAIIKRYLEIYGKVYNYISIDNLQAIRYIKKAGAVIYLPQKWGINGELFVPFVIER